MITVSIVSHNQFSIALQTIKSFHAISNSAFFYIITINTAEKISEKLLKSIVGKNYKLIINRDQIGFGQNHNNASKEALGNIFIICNPDIEINSFDIANLIKKASTFDLIAPRVCLPNKSSYIYDFRSFPALHRVFFRQCLRIINRMDHDIKEYEGKHSWFPGYFMAIDINVFNKLGGFDTNFFMYCEDVDLCLRLKKGGYKIDKSDDILVSHIGQFSSNKKFRYFYMHLVSIIKLNLKMLKGYY